MMISPKCLPISSPRFVAVFWIGAWGGVWFVALRRRVPFEPTAASAAMWPTAFAKALENDISVSLLPSF